MTPRTLELLRLLQHSPRTMKSLTHGDYSAHPVAISGWMDRLMDAGYAESDGAHPNRRYYITPLGESYLASRPPVAASRYLCNAAMTSVYVPPAWTSARPGADDHRRYRSAGKAC